MRQDEAGGDVVGTRADGTLPVETQTRRGRIDFLDAIRGVASLIVVFQHAFEVWLPGYKDWSADYLNLGRLGIVAFFLVSGYVVGLTLTSQSARTFAIRRFWRLYPAYWVATALYMLVEATTPGGPSLDYGLFVLLLNVTMLHGVIGVTSILGVSWTLGMEIAFYAQSAAGKVLRMLERTVWLGFVWLAAFVGLAFYDRATGAAIGTLTPLMLFTASAGFSLFLWDRYRHRSVFAYAAAIVLVVPVVGWLFVTAEPTPAPGWGAFSFGASYLAGVALFAAFYVFRARPSGPALLWLGALSYGLYLVHPTVIRLVEQFGGPNPVMFPLAVLGSLVAAWVLHRAVEKPSIAYGRRLTGATDQA